MSYLFGPVPSRRLGRSLGVDLVPHKTCTFDCIYCEVGLTTHLSLKRRPYEIEAIIFELTEYLRTAAAPPDFITLAGSGEPTLNLGLDRVIAAVKEMMDIPVAVLTNGALLHLPEVRESLAAADVVLPSLDAAREGTFRLINRPAPGLSLAMILKGLETFRREYGGQIWLEIMVLKGINDQEPELLALRQEIRRISPDKVQLNTAVRPVVEDWAQPLNREEMAEVAAFLGEGAEIIAEFDRILRAPAVVPDQAFVDMLSRRPMTAQDLAQALGLSLSQVEKRLDRLQGAGLISLDRYQEEGFYRSETTG